MSSMGDLQWEVLHTVCGQFVSSMAESCNRIIGNGGGLQDGMSRVAKMSHDKRRGPCLVMHWPGLPLPGSPLAFLSPPNSSIEQ